uniref:VASt domain-containing protein n=1 Tax=Macrostomum lignano TaxID=282301 RepID=A0A1I8F7P3_9PLAT
TFLPIVIHSVNELADQAWLLNHLKALPTVELHDQQQQLRQRQSEPQLLQSVSCHLADGHEHLDHVMADADIPMSVEQLAQCLLTDGPWFRDFLQRRRTFGIEASDFEDENGKRWRRRSGASARRWLRDSDLRLCKPGKLHVVDCECTTGTYPTARLFHTLNRMCLTCRGPGRSHLTITSRTVFTRAVFLAKSFIESNVREGSQTYFRLMVDTLLDPNAGKTPINDEGGASARLRRPPSGLVNPCNSSCRRAAAGAALVGSFGCHLQRRCRAARQPSVSRTAPAGPDRRLIQQLSQRRRHLARLRCGPVECPDPPATQQDGGQRLLQCPDVLPVLVSLHLRFQSLDSSLDARSACAPAGDASRTGAAFTREQLDIWRRALDETLGSLDGLLFELRRVATAEATAAAPPPPASRRTSGL